MSASVLLSLFSLLQKSDKMLGYRAFYHNIQEHICFRSYIIWHLNYFEVTFLVYNENVSSISI